MSTPRKWRGTRVAATILAAGLAAMAMALPANAADVNIVDPARDGSLTIHKYEAPTTPTGLPNNGTQQNVPLPPLPGVGFTVYKVDPIDLTTNAGWVDASQLSTVFDGTTGSITGAGYTVTAVGGQQLTNAAGEISLTGLDLGLYYVVETSPLPGSTGVAPFLVTVPLTDPDTDNAWLYDVHVYPKNALTTVTKKVEDSEDVKLGDPIEWTITGDIPNVAQIDGYKITDDLDPKLDFVSAAVTLSDGTTLTAGVHYNVTPAAATAGGPLVEVIFTQAGLDLLEAHTAATVGVVITTTVNAIGEIENTALLYPNSGSFTVQPGQPGGPIVTPPVATKWGEITVKKVNEAGAGLAGAVFSVYPTQQDAIDDTNAIALGSPAATTFTVAADGTVTISGLRYSDFADGVTNVGEQTYWLAEITAPDGYELLAAPIEFSVTAGTTAIGVDLEVVNVPNNGGFELPLTGGTGTTMFWAGGTMLLAGAVFLAVYSRRKSNSAA